MASQISLVVGAAKGLGHGLVTEIASSNPSHKVIAAVLEPTDFSSEFGNIETILLDQTNPESVADAARMVDELDTLILNAGIGNFDHLTSTTTERFQQYFNVNVLGTFRSLRAFLPALERRSTRRIVVVSSQSGSLAKQIGAPFGLQGPYAMTKAALNMMAVQLHNELHSRGYVVVPVNPGWVWTDMGSQGDVLEKAKELGISPTPVDVAAKSFVRLVESLKFEDSAKFFDTDGTLNEW